MKLPSNVARYEQLMYLSLGVGVIQSMLQWNRLVANARAQGGAAFVLFIQVSVLALMVLIIWLALRRRKNWARWLMLILFVLGTPLALPSIGQSLRINPVIGTLSCLQCLAQIVALFLVFTGNAREWFQPVGVNGVPSSLP